MKAKALRDKILIHNLEKGERKTSGGIVLVDDDKKAGGVRPRWAQIYDVGPEVKDPEIIAGRWILVEHGRWTRGMVLEDDNGERLTVWGIQWPDPILLISDEQPVEFAERYS